MIQIMNRRNFIKNTVATTVGTLFFHKLFAATHPDYGTIYDNLKGIPAEKFRREPMKGELMCLCDMPRLKLMVPVTKVRHGKEPKESTENIFHFTREEFISVCESGRRYERRGVMVKYNFNDCEIGYHGCKHFIQDKGFPYKRGYILDCLNYIIDWKKKTCSPTT